MDERDLFDYLSRNLSIEADYGGDSGTVKIRVVLRNPKGKLEIIASTDEIDLGE